MQPQKYRGKPVIIEAMQLTRNVAERKAIMAWVGEGNLETEKEWDPINLHIKTQNGVTVAEPGDWIVKGTQGDFYPCKNATFQEKYEPIAQAQTGAGTNARR